MRTKTPEQADKMLDAAARLFGAQRFHEVRMEDIASEAEVGKGTLYRYFEDKEELYLALLARSSAQFLARFEEELHRPTTARARLESLIQAIINYFDDQPHLLDLIQRAEVSERPGRESPWHKIRGDLVRLLTEFFADAQARGEFTIRDPELGTHMLLGGLRSIIRFGPRPRSDGLPERIAAEFLYGADSSRRAEPNDAALMTADSR
jgi:AcrR family transcriptional regulator